MEWGLRSENERVHVRSALRGMQVIDWGERRGGLIGGD